jgi:predicted nucleic acid-binding Zn ribbon protein
MSGKKGNEEFQTVGQAIRSLLNSYRLESKFDEAALVASWERLVGGPIAKRTKKIFIKDHVLFVEFKSPSMKNDFLLHKSKVLEVFQKEFGTALVKDIVIL